MAKRQPIPTSEQIIKELGYEIDPIAHSHSPGRLYADLSPVPQDPFEKLRRELEASRAARQTRWQTIKRTDKSCGEVNIRENAGFGYLRFSVDVEFAPGMSMPFLLSQDEMFDLTYLERAGTAIYQVENGNLTSAQQLQHETKTCIGTLIKLPPEIREKIFKLSLHRGDWDIPDADTFLRHIFLKSLGDPSGFYFPLYNRPGLLSVNKQIRMEVLPLAYRCSTFRFDDMDALIRFLLAVGRIGRENVETLDFAWESPTDTSERWALFPGQDVSLQLPSLHVSRCVELLLQCRRLRHLRVRIQEAVLSSIPVQDFKTNPGIKALCSLHSIEKVDVLDPFDETLNQYEQAVWLKEQLETPGRLK